jgi:hypothetical protein
MIDPVLLYTNEMSKFILPLIVKDEFKFKDICTNFVNTYISMLNYPMYDQKIILVFNDHILNDFTIEDNIEYIIEKRDTDIDHIYIYDIPEHLVDDYYAFLRGDYSDLSEDSKRRILDFWERGDDSILYSILYRDNTNIKKHIKRIESSKPEFPIFKEIYLSLLNRYQNKKELFSPPDLTKHIYGCSDEL